MSISYAPVRLVYLQTTSSCNLDCSYCYIPREQRTQQEFLSLGLARGIFEKLFLSPLCHTDFRIYFCGNEPLVLPLAYYEELFSIFNRVEAQHNHQNLGIRFFMQTNGTLITPEWCDFFKRNNIYVAVSLDGPAFLHDAYRKSTKGEKTHEQVMAGIQLLQEHKIDFFINCVLTKQTLGHPGSVYQFFLENNIHQVNFNLEERNASYGDSSLKYEGLEEHYRYFMSIFWDLNQIAGGKIQLFDFEDTLNSIDQPPEKRVSNPYNSPCTFLNIDYQGNFSTYSPELLLAANPQRNDFILGNFQTTSLEAALETEKFQTIKQDIDAGIQQCETTCDFMNYCNGGSPHQKSIENGTFNSTQNTACTLKIKALIDLTLGKMEYQAMKYKYRYAE